MIQKRKLTGVLSVFLLSLMWSCGGTEKKSENTETSTESTATTAEIKLTKAPGSPAYEESVLTLMEPYQDKASADSIPFDFTVSNYELGAQTEGAAERGIANSGKGQHIHLIVNNGPYSAHYGPQFKKPMEEGDYIILAFLSRSYHESVKNPNAFATKQLTVGNATTEPFDFNAQHLFYSRPKGTYKGADTEKVMLDFYLLNTELSEDGNKVRATINGQEFMITEWAPFYIENAPKGDLNVKLELLDNEGNLIPGRFNSVERIVKLEE